MEEDFQDIPEAYRDFCELFGHGEEESAPDTLLTRDCPRTGPWQGFRREWLLRLRLPPDKAGSELISLKGRFRVEGKNTRFFARTTQGEMEELSCSLCADRLLPLLELFDQRGHEIELDGDVQNNVFRVNELHIIPSWPIMSDMALVEAKASDKRLQAVLRRAFAPGGEGGRAVFSTQEELELLFCLCRDDYPPSIQEWAEGRLESLQLSGLGPADKRHILRGLSYMLNIDWTGRPARIPELAQVRELLDRRFFGLESVKRQILELAARMRQTGAIPRWGILLNGPPGVGKTAFANFIAQLLGLPMAYLEFSVLRDSEGISGTPRVYDNAKPGLVVEQLYAKRTSALVMVLNELDKAAEGKGGGSLLDVLIPLLDGTGFTDTYIETAIPTDGIFFIATANDADRLSGPVLDRFYRIDIPAYSQMEKKAIFDRHVLPQALDRAGLAADEVELTEDARMCLLRDYALEPGIRDLERMAEKMVSNYLLQKEETRVSGTVFSSTELRGILGPPKAVGRNFITRPGVVFSACCVEGAVRTFAFQAAVRPGNGALRLINVESQRQREYCRMAYEAVRLFAGGRLALMDVALAASVPLGEDSARNYTGCAACAAIFSALRGVTYGGLFLGGCDLYGGLYLDESALDLYVKHLAGRFNTIYGAVGMAELMYESHPLACLSVVEAPDIFALLQMAGTDWPRRLRWGAEDRKEERDFGSGT